MTAPVGVVIVSTDNWDAQLRALAALRPSVVRLQLFSDQAVAQSWGPAFGEVHVNAVAAHLAPGGTLILRTAETLVNAGTMRAQLTATFPDSGKAVADYLNGTIAPSLLLEVGNEPDQAGVDPFVARWNVLTGLRVARTLLHNRAIGVGLPTVAAGQGYLDAFLSDTGDGLGRIPSEADALAWHCYGANTLEDSDALHQRQELATVLGSGLPVYVTEAGIDEPRPWADRAQWYARFVAGLPEEVKGVCFFLLDSADPRWANYRLGEEGVLALRGALDALSTPVTPAHVPTSAPVAPPIDLVSPPAAEERRMADTTGADVSMWQRGMDYQAFKDSGRAFLGIKATEGVGYTDAALHEHAAGAQAAGLVRLFYVYGRPDLNGPEAEADYAWAVLKDSIADEDGLALDFEQVKDIGIVADLSGWALAWLRRMAVNAGRTPLLYTFPSYLTAHGLGTPELAAFPLWYAYYPASGTPDQWPAVPGAWDTISVWQWSGGTSVPGIPGDADADVTHLDRAGLIALIGAHATASPPTPTPGPAPVARGPYFAETDKWVIEPFLTYWRENGGLTVFGLPVSGLYRETRAGPTQGLLVQYFERARLELQPDLATITRGRVGAELAALLPVV